MKQKITLTQEQKEQVSAFIREVYDFNYKGGRVFLSGAGFAYQRLACSAKYMEIHGKTGVPAHTRNRRRLRLTQCIQAARRSLQTDE